MPREASKVTALRYHGLLYRLDGSYRRLLWYSNEVDGLHVERGQFPVSDEFVERNGNRFRHF
jgi:hypothetical protein